MTCVLQAPLPSPMPNPVGSPTCQGLLFRAQQSAHGLVELAGDGQQQRGGTCTQSVVKPGADAQYWPNSVQQERNCRLLAHAATLAVSK